MAGPFRRLAADVGSEKKNTSASPPEPSEIVTSECLLISEKRPRGPIRTPGKRASVLKAADPVPKIQASAAVFPTARTQPTQVDFLGQNRDDRPQVSIRRSAHDHFVAARRDDSVRACLNRAKSRAQHVVGRHGLCKSECRCHEKPLQPARTSRTFAPRQTPSRCRPAPPPRLPRRFRPSFA